MRTTLTLEPDVAARLEQRRRERQTSLKREVNDLLRAGLAAAEAPSTQTSDYQLPVFDVGGLLIPIDDVHGALAIAEGDDYK
jgi:hypothetical protein